jgi:phenylacetate-CoA ligase
MEQWLSSEEIANLQLKRLRSLIAVARERSDYYRDRLHDSSSSDICSIQDIAGLPLLTRADLQNSCERIRCRGIAPVFPDTTGGSTGEPVRFYHDTNHRHYHAALELLFLSWMNIRPGARTLAFWGADRDFKQMSLRERINLKLSRMRILNSFSMDQAALQDFLEEAARYRPEYIIGYASSLAMIAEQLQRSDSIVLRPRAVRSAAEMLYNHQREAIENAFGCRPFNFYGSREVSHLAAECDQHDGLHIFESGRIIEITDESGRPLPDGAIGCIVVTDLTNLGFPFIRYKNGDMGIMAEGTCSCGRGLRRLRKIVGRSSDILIFNGKAIHGEFFTHLFYNRDDTKQFQVIQENEKQLTVSIVPVEGPFDTEPLEAAIREQIGSDVRVDIRFVDIISVSDSGKYRFTINRMSDHSNGELKDVYPD